MSLLFVNIGDAIIEQELALVSTLNNNSGKFISTPRIQFRQSQPVIDPIEIITLSFPHVKIWIFKFK